MLLVRMLVRMLVLTSGLLLGLICSKMEFAIAARIYSLFPELATCLMKLLQEDRFALNSQKAAQAIFA